MSRRHQIANRLAAYSGVKTILSAMKSIAMMELHKLGEQRERQLIIMATVEKVAADFMTSYTLPVESGRKVLIAIGSERGFCGKFNEELLPGIH
ncbi:MAG TPA: F0F1 ATP synthase subunit gamma, partial [Alphaproteobacteria bacterium]|nr:F0F1 ATP synthase subunit gamma [Alphaproteobacteria bacterium]